MWRAKRSSSGFAVYSEDDDAHGLKQLSLAGDLRHAIEHDELYLHYQPKVYMDASSFCGVEALLRWQHPVNGMIAPDVFIPLAEHTGVMEPLTRLVLGQALRNQSEWRRHGHDIPISVNLSPTTLHDTRFPDTVAALLDQWGAPACNLSLEITESAIMSDVVCATDTVRRLDTMGVRISIDDFGTGYTSFAYIRKLPISEIKVDKSFVLNMRPQNDDHVIVRSIVNLGRSLGVEVVAEGVEDQDAWDLLAVLGCNEAQGYFIGRPMPEDALLTWLNESPWAAGRHTSVA